MAMRYTYLWEFHVDRTRKDAFERHYGPRGPWVALFRQAPGFIETLLLRDPANPLRYVTVDRWQSAEAYRTFRSTFAVSYAELDAHCQQLTTKELALGHFDEFVE